MGRTPDGSGIGPVTGVVGVSVRDTGEDSCFVSLGEIALDVLVSVDEVGTLLLRDDRCRDDFFPAEDVVVDMMMRSMWEAMLSDESFRLSAGPGSLDVRARCGLR